MKFLFVATFAFALICCVISKPAEDKYTTKYDGINLDEILKSDRLFNNYFKCLMDQGKCTPDGSELKRLLPDALKTSCEKCSEKQKAGTDKVIRYLVDNKAEQWKQLQAKYDPEHIYVEAHKEEAGQAGIAI